jgi:hypothetical protein
MDFRTLVGIVEKDLANHGHQRLSDEGWSWEKEVRGAINQVSVVDGPARTGENFADRFLCRLVHWRFTVSELGERRLARKQPPQRTIDRTADDNAVVGVIKRMLDWRE